MAHRNYRSMLDELTTLPIASGQRYRHYKTNDIYQIDKLVMLEATDEVGVAYYNEQQPDIVWIRSYADFTAHVDDQTPRFSLLN